MSPHPSTILLLLLLLPADRRRVLQVCRPSCLQRLHCPFLVHPRNRCVSLARYQHLQVRQQQQHHHQHGHSTCCPI
uniref:Putative secreted peptide n=1 Tax=Anopheles braziliensis TaxID=58242 RepID=A0A2M3ZTB6_9DIPT